MESFDWTATIDINLQVLRAVGLWPKGLELYKRNLYTLYACSAAIVVLGGHNLSQIINMFHVYTDLEALTATIFVTITNLLAAVKMYFFVRNMGLIKRLLTTLNSQQFRPKNLHQVRLVQHSLRRWKVLYFLYCGIVYINVMMWSLNPILNGWVKDHGLPFQAWYPFDVQVSPNYELAYLYQLYCIWHTSVANINLDSNVIAFLMFTWCQCDILCDDLRSLDDGPSFGTRFIKCIKHHKAILRFAEDSSNFYNMIVLGQFATSTAALALTMFQLSLVETMSGEFFTHLSYIVGLTTQILLYCWFGNEVEIKSSKTLSAVYDSKWVGQPQSVTKNILIFGMRCQKPIKITAINLFTLSLETFIAILRSAWSYFALLTNVDNTE